jgi:hypothetical protein
VYARGDEGVHVVVPEPKFTKLRPELKVGSIVYCSTYPFRPDSVSLAAPHVKVGWVFVVMVLFVGSVGVAAMGAVASTRNCAVTLEGPWLPAPSVALTFQYHVPEERDINFEFAVEVKVR